jgi:BNR/Asp-box repeat
MSTELSWRASGIAIVTVALLTVLPLSGCRLASPSTAESATTRSPAPPSTAIPVPASSMPATTPAAASPATGPSPSGPAPAKFAATSVTFVSADEAFLLGTEPCASKSCTSIMRTLDRGASWVRLPAPAVPLAGPGTSRPAAWGIRFADASHGFVFGNGLWESTDGGQQWTAVPGPGGYIIDLEVIDNQVLALASTCNATQSNCDASATLFRRALPGSPWYAVTKVSGARVIATQARVAAVLNHDSLIVTADGGLAYATRATPCASLNAAGERPAGSVAVAVTGPGSLALLCGGGIAAGSAQKMVFVSDDLGAHWVKAGAPPFGGDPTGISGATPEQLVVEAVSGGSWLYYSADGGIHWSAGYFAGDGGAGFNDLGFTTTTDGVVVHGPAASAGPGQLLLTDDGGATWTTVTP